MIKKLRLKFVLINMSIVTIMLCVMLSLVLYFTGADLEAENIRMMQGIANQPFELSLPDNPGEDVRLPFFTLQLGPGGELVSAGGGYYDLTDGKLLETLIEEAFSSPRSLGVIDRYNLRYYRVDSPVNPYLVFSDISSERATLDGLAQTCFIIGGISFFVFLWISIALSKWAVRPVEAAWKQQREFVAAASHELKTPLTVITTDAELLHGGICPDEKRPELTGGILTMARQMRSLVEQLLELARAESGERRRAFAPLSLSKAVEDAALPFEPVFFEKGLELAEEIEPGIRLTGSEDELRELTGILLDNAVKYSKPGGSCRLILRRHGRRRSLLSVENEGEPLSREQLESVFKRFYRADPARCRNGSFGLGLAIAQGIVSGHGGKIRAESRGGWNIFSAELPCE